MSTNQKTLLYMITVFGAIYSHEVSNLDIPLKEADDFIDEYPLLFEKIDVDPQECAGKSIYKYVHNGKLLSTSIISKIKKEDLSISLISIVENLYKNDPQQYKDAILFDTINQNIF